MQTQSVPSLCPEAVLCRILTTRTNKAKACKNMIQAQDLPNSSPEAAVPYSIMETRKTKQKRAYNKRMGIELDI